MLELYSKKRFVVIFKDCPFDGDWKNCYLKENEIDTKIRGEKLALEQYKLIADYLKK